MEIFTELSLIIVITLVIAGLMKAFKQPLIIGYIFTGIICGPLFLNIIKATDTISFLSHIGIALLLFIVGLNLSPKVIKEVGKVSTVTGVTQVIFTTTIGFFLSKLFGFSTTTSLYIAVGLAFSSTIIIMKLISDKGDIGTLYGRISIGFLIVQDIIAVIILLVISSFPSHLGFIDILLGPILQGIVLIGFLLLCGIFILPKATGAIAKSQEFLFLFSIGWCLALASLFHIFGYSMEIGALLAGLTLSMSPYRFEISSRMRPLRDFFIVLFFILLGSQMVFISITDYIVPVIAFSALILIGNPLIVMSLMGVMGYSKRNSFLAGLAVAQISEFSLIIIALGAKVGDLSNEILSLITIVALVTIAGSTYMIIYSNQLYTRLSRYLSIFEKKGKKVDEHRHHSYEHYDIILFGCNRIGYSLLESFTKIKKKFLIVDYNPEKITKLAKEGFECRFGDANDPELLNDFDFSKTKMIVSTLHNFDTDFLIISKAREQNEKIIITVVSHQVEEAMKLYDIGATYVLMPHFLGGHHVSTMIEENKLNFNLFLKEKVAHVEHLKMRKKLGHEHPKHDRH